MKKFLALLGSVFLGVSTVSNVVSCVSGVGFNPVYDEDGNDVTDKGADSKQFFDYSAMRRLIEFLPSGFFETSKDFKINLHKKSANDDLAPKYSLTKDKTFNFNFKLLVTSYSSIDKNVIKQIEENDLKEEGAGIYLFLNSPGIDLDNIKNVQNLVFQFIFIIKNQNGKIRGNIKNKWFYWREVKWINILEGPGGNNDEFREKFGGDAFFFNISKKSEDFSAKTFVVTKYWD